MPTKRITFLNTRPELQNQQLSAVLAQQLPIDLITLPTLEIMACPIEDKIAKIQPRLQPTCWIFTSTNAVQFSQTVIPTTYKTNPVIAIGAATAAALKQQGWYHIYQPSKASSEDVLAMPQLQPGQCQQIILVKGLGGRELIAQQLTAKGIQVVIIDCYRRALPNQRDTQKIEQINTQRIDIVLITSLESFNNLQKILSGTVKKLYETSQWLVFSDRIKHYLTSFIPESKIWVCEPSEQAVVDMTKRIAKEL